MIPAQSTDVTKVARTNRVFNQALADVKQTIADDGFMSIGEYITCRDKYQLDDDALLPEIQQAGYGFVKTAAVNPDLPQEVIVDLRFLAACMLLVYSDPTYALHFKVLKVVELLHRAVYSETNFAVAVLGDLLKDTYTEYGHVFTVMSMANRAEIGEESQESDEFMIELAERHHDALQQLQKHDAELTAVYHLCVNTMFLVNNEQIDAKLANTFRGAGSPKAYRYFWKAALRITDRMRQEVKAKVRQQPHSCNDSHCTHQH